MAAALLIAVNIVAALIHKRFDLTEENRYSLSTPTKELLASLDSTVSIDVFVSGNELPAVVRKFQTSMDDFLSELSEASGNRLEYRFVNPYENVADTAQERLVEDSLYNNFGLIPFVLDAPEKVGDKLEITKLVHGAVIRYGADSYAPVNFLEGTKTYGASDEERRALYNELESKLEYKFASALQKLTLKEKPVVAYALGHGEAWGYNVNDLVRTLIGNYRFDTINIKQATHIPASVEALVITKPTVPFNNDDKFKIDQYVMHGGKVIWMVDNMYAEFDSLYKSNGFVAFDRALNLEDILFNYGVRINQTLLQDMNCDKLPQVSNEGGTQQQRLVDWPFFPILNGSDHPISKNLDGIRTLFPTTLDTVEAKGIAKTFLLHSSNNTRLLTAPAKIDFEFLQIAPDQSLFRHKPTPVAVLLEGNFRSLFTGRTPLAIMDSLKNTDHPFKANAGNNKMIVISDGDIAMNQYSQMSGPLPMGMNLFTRYTYANKDFFLNCLEYLVNPTDILQTRSKEYSLRLLDPKLVQERKATWQAINIVLPVVLIILFGILFQYLRRQKFAAA